MPDYLQGPYQFWRGGQDEQGNRTTRRCFVIWDVISQALRKRAIENNPTSYQGFNVGLHELQRSMQTAAHTRWVGTSSCFLQTPHSQRTPGTVQLQGGASPVITLNTPGEDFGKDSPGHDRIQKLGSTSWNISHNPRTFAIKPYGAKQKSIQLFVMFKLRLRLEQPSTEQGQESTLWALQPQRKGGSALPNGLGTSGAQTGKSLQLQLLVVSQVLIFIYSLHFCLYSPCLHDIWIQ